jgi:hypothetical protein
VTDSAPRARRSSIALAAAVAALLTLAPASAQSPSRRETTADSTVPFTPGERFEYTVKLGLFTAGRASMEVIGIDTVRGVPCYHVVFAVRGRALFYSLNDSLQSWFGVEDFLSRRFIQDNEENGRQRYRRYEIFPERGVWIRNDTDTAATVPEPLDDASFFYFARTLPFEVGRSYELPRYFIRDRNPVTLRVLQRQTVGTPAGRFQAVAVRPVFRSRGLFAQGGEAVVWFSDDERRIPVRIRSRLSVGVLDLSLRARS